MNSKLLSIIAVLIGILLPMKVSAQMGDYISAPEFTFEGDNIVMTCETQGANIYYVMSEFANEEEAYSLSEALDVSEANSMRTLYTQPFPVTSNVVIKAVAKMPQQQEESDVKTIIYSYTAWSELLEAIDYGSDVLARAQDNPNVSDDLKDNLKWMLEEGEMFYQQRGMMYDSYEAVMIRQHILEIAHQIEEILGPAQTNPEPYAVLSQNNTVLTFYYDEKKAERSGMDINNSHFAFSPYGTATIAVFDASFADYRPTSTAYWFMECSSLTVITGLENLKTDKVMDMKSMFYNCSSLTSLDVSGFNTQNVTNMSSMFYFCSSLTNLDVSHFNTQNVTDMGNMFNGCSNLTSLDVTHFNTQNVTDMGSMFWGCTGLTSLDVSGFKTENVTNMVGMFNGCSGLTSLDVTGFNTQNVMNMGTMFNLCSSLTSLDVTGFNTQKVTEIRGMFAYCSGLTSLDVTAFNTQNLKNMINMFQACSGLTTLDLSGFNTQNVKYMESMFNGCSGLTTIYVGNDWSTSAVTSANNMFSGCTSLVGGAGTHYDANHTDYTYAHIDGGTANPGYFTATGAEPWTEPNAEPYAVLSQNNTVVTFYYDDQKAARGGVDINDSDLIDNNYNSPYGSATTAVIDASFADYRPTSTAYWFTRCSSLTSITGMENLKTDNVTDMSCMFAYCRNLENLDLSGLKTENVTDMSHMFDRCSSLTSLDLSNFRTDNVTDMSYVFEFCTSLTSLNISSFNTAKVTDMSGLFYDCEALTNLDVKNFNTDQVNNMSWLFMDCSSLTDIDVTHFNTANVTDMGSMFSGCSGLTSLDITNFKTGKVTSMMFMFYGCSGLTSLDISNFETNEVTSMRRMFGDCNRLISLDLSNFNTEKVVDMWRMFYGCSVIESLYASDGWSTASITNGTENGTEMFGGCTNLVGGAGTRYDANHTDHTYAHIDGGTANPGYFTDKNAPAHTDPEPYAVLSQNNTVLTFYYDDQREQRNGMDINNSYIDANSNSPYGNATTAVIDASFTDYRPTSTAYWFMRCSSLNSITGMENLKTDNVTDMDRMFEDCSGLTSLNVTGFNTQEVTDMSFMFASCSGLTSLDVSNFKTDNVTNMAGMFYECSGLTSLDLSNFKTDNVTNMASMFLDCSGLASLDLSNFKTGNVTNMSFIFSECSGLTSLDLSNFKTDNVTNMAGMFYGCSSLTSLDMSNFKTDNVTNMSGMFYDCSGLTSLNVSHFITSKVMHMCTDYQYRGLRLNLGMFRGCSSLMSLDLSNFNTENVTRMDYMFAGCSNLISLDLSGFNTENVTRMDYMLFGCSSLASIQAGSANIPAEEYANIANPNLLVYVNEASLAPQGVQNVVINGEAKEIILTDVTEGNNNWHCPEPFGAWKISYTRNFKQQTEVGISRGWESIALPFTVQTITHETQGQIVPFGLQGKNFWLRGYSPDGLYNAATIEANKPYVISMPNNPTVYPAQYNLNGRVTFSAENTTVPATPEFEEMLITRGNITMAPIFVAVPRDEAVYAINVSQPLDRYAEGSVFTRELREVRPFEAATTHEPVNGARPKYIRIAAQPDDDITGIRTIELDETEGTWYSLDGRQLQGQPQRKGVYLQKGKKIVVK